MRGKRAMRLVVLGGILMMAVPSMVQAMAHKSGGDALPAAEGKAVLEYITEANPYEKWPMWPGKEALYEGTEPHGVLLTTYVNEKALAPLKEGKGEMPDGAIIVKENYKPNKELAAVTVMYKKTGYDPDAGDYFWLKYAPDGSIQAEGKVQSCIGCHKAAKGNDLLYTND